MDMASGGRLINSHSASWFEARVRRSGQKQFQAWIALFHRSLICPMAGDSYEMSNEIFL